MIKAEWRNLILKCQNNKRQLDLLTELLYEIDVVRQLLIDNGYGCTGMGLFLINFLYFSMF